VWYFNILQLSFVTETEAISIDMYANIKYSLASIWFSFPSCRIYWTFWKSVINNLIPMFIEMNTKNILVFLFCCTVLTFHMPIYYSKSCFAK